MAKSCDADNLPDEFLTMVLLGVVGALPSGARWCVAFFCQCRCSAATAKTTSRDSTALVSAINNIRSWPSSVPPVPDAPFDLQSTRPDKPSRDEALPASDSISKMAIKPITGVRMHWGKSIGGSGGGGVTRRLVMGRPGKANLQ